jgi:hypothetical protein
MTGDYARTPIGQPLVGDFEAEPLQITELVLEAFIPDFGSCDGSGPAGQVLLHASGPKPPIEGQVARHRAPLS